MEFSPTVIPAKTMEPGVITAPDFMVTDSTFLGYFPFFRKVFDRGPGAEPLVAKFCQICKVF